MGGEGRGGEGRGGEGRGGEERGGEGRGGEGRGGGGGGGGGGRSPTMNLNSNGQHDLADGQIDRTDHNSLDKTSQ